MKKLRSFLVLTACCLLPSACCFSQPITKAQFRELFTQGNLMMLDSFYDSAVKNFLRLNTSDPSNANVNYKIGRCYLQLPAEKLKAIPYLENALRQTAGNYREDDPSEKNAPEDVLYYLGMAYHYGYRFDEAMVHFKKFRDLVGKWNLNLVKEIDHWNDMSKNAKELIAKPVECTITNLGDSVNCEFADYSPAITADEAMLVFTSRRLGTGGAANKTINDDFFEDIWICKQGKYGSWTKAKSISRSINTDGNEATIGLSADGQQLYVYRDDNGDGNIYISKLDGEFWETPYKMDAYNVNSIGWEPSACISADGNTMYFVSNREGGFGGRDIYQCHLLPNRSWSAPENLGPSINTPYEEDAPFIHPDGVTFFFSSTGLNSMGGFDVFHSTKVANNVWTDPVNIGYPINTTDDDIYFVTSSDGRRAYYASFRPGGKGEKDIYMVSMPKPFVQSVAILVGYLKNRDGSPIPQHSSVTAKASTGEIIVSKPNEASGKFILSQLPGKEYEITIEANAQRVFMDKFFLPQDSSYQNLARGFFQRTIFIGDTARVFSMNQPAGLNSGVDTKIETIPMDGILLLSTEPADIAPSVTLSLLNSQGNVISSVVTDDKGKFKFDNVPSSQKYTIKINENDSVLLSRNQFYLADKDNKIIMPSIKDDKFLLFKHIAPELNKPGTITANDASSLTTMAGKLTTGDKGKKGLAKATVNLLDENGKVIRTKTTDLSGRFSFENIPSDKNYTVSINENDPSLKNIQKLYLMNQREELIKQVARLTDYFIFEHLPADLNKLSPINAPDDTQVVAMKGRVMKSGKAEDGIGNLDVYLIDNKGKVLQSAKTDFSGMFKFEKLSSDNNYTVKFNEDDALFASLKKVYLANEADKIVKVIDVNKNLKSFKNLPADLMKLAELKDAYLTSDKDSMPPVIYKKVMYPGDEKFDFVVYFPYNKKEINITVGSFLELMEKVAKTINEKGKSIIQISASSSTVPTKSFTSNEILSESRANEIKDKVRASMSLKNLDAALISYEIESKVQGPEYKNDAVQNRKEYERWQFVKVIVK